MFLDNRLPVWTKLQQTTSGITKPVPTAPLPATTNAWLKFMALVSFFWLRRPVIIVAGLNGSRHSSPFDPFLILVTHANLTAAD